MYEQYRCPACQRPLRRRPGMEDMPASQEYWECPFCGLDAHSSRLSTPTAREDLKRQHLAALKQRAEDGRLAQFQLRATPLAWCTADHIALLLATGAVALSVGALIGRLLAGTRSD